MSGFIGVAASVSITGMVSHKGNTRISVVFRFQRLSVKLVDTFDGLKRSSNQWVLSVPRVRLPPKLTGSRRGCALSCFI